MTVPQGTFLAAASCLGLLTEVMFGATAEEAPWKGMFEVTLSPSVLQSHDGCFSAAGLAKDEERRRPGETQESKLPSNSEGTVVCPSVGRKCFIKMRAGVGV